MLFQILLDGAEPRDAGRPGCLLQFAGGEANRILLASALLSMLIICPNRVSQCDWIIAVSLGCFVSLHTSSFQTNWYHLMPSSICTHTSGRAHRSYVSSGTLNPTIQYYSVQSTGTLLFLLWSSANVCFIARLITSHRRSLPFSAARSAQYFISSDRKSQQRYSPFLRYSSTFRSAFSAVYI